MLAEFHLLRPVWLITAVPLLALIWHLWHQTPATEAWSNVCDAHLLGHLIQKKGRSRRKRVLLWLLIGASFLIIGLAGPTWSRFPVPTFQPVQPHVLLLDMTYTMLEKDLPPNRLSRAKFKLHDLFTHHAGQFGLVVYTGEPFVLSPLTNDGNTIDALLETLTPDIMPVSGHRLDSALLQAKQLIEQAGFERGDVLVLTASLPSSQAIDAAQTISQKGINVSIMPMIGRGVSVGSRFKDFAQAGDGQVISFSDTSSDIDKWLGASQTRQRFNSVWQDEVPVWRDQGRWFLIPALLFLLPLFRRGWLQGLDS